MIRELDTVTLRDGAPMTIRLIEPPAGEYAERLTRFLEHKGDGTARDIAQRLRGDYVADCLDRFFVGEIEDRIAAQMWYTLPRERPDFGVFGHVYTEPEQRGRGAASTLMGPLMADFLAGPGQGLFCGVGDPGAQRIYARHGFVPLLPERAPVGPQAFIRPEVAADFAALQALVFAPDVPTRTRPAHMGDRARVDKLLHQADAVRARAGSWHRVHLAARYPDFVPAFQATEDGRGVLQVLQTERGYVVGYAFALAAGSEIERGAAALDFLVHPAYEECAPELIGATVEAAQAGGVTSVRCWLAGCDAAKLGAIETAGGAHEHTFAGYCTVSGQAVDLLVYRLA